MGKTKIKVIDDSKSQVEEKPRKQEKKGKPEDALVEKLKAELGITEEETKSVKEKGVDKEIAKSEDVTQTKAGDAEEGSRASTAVRRDVGRGRTRDTEAAGPAELKPSERKKVVSKVKPRSKKYQEAKKLVEPNHTYPLAEAVELTKKISYSKFNGSLEAHINTHQLGIRGLVSLPHFEGKKIKILAFPSTTLRTSGLIKQLEDEGVVIGDDTTLEQIEKGKIDFDLLITTPEWMPKLAKLAKFLGPKGLMPNPKNGTITDDLKKTVESFRQGKTEYKTEPKAPIIHLSLGKLNQPSEELSSNVKALLSTLGKSKIKKVTLSPTMGPSVKLDLSSI